MVSMRLALREHTSTAHRGLDHHPLLAPLVRKPLRVKDYIQALQSLHGPQAKLEAALQSLTRSAQLPPRLRDLESDLLDLHATPLPVVVDLPVFNSEAARCGALYVLEGANMGGRVIARQLMLSLPPGISRRFFERCEGPARWERYWAWVGHRLDTDALPEMVRGAEQTFDFYRAHMNRCADTYLSPSVRH